MKKLLIAVCLIFSASSLVAEPATFKIGAVLPLSGSNAGHGEFARQGIEMALQEILPNIKVFYEDDLSTTKGAVTAFERLKSIENIDAAVFIGSNVGMALSPLANQKKVLLFGVIATPDYTSPNDYTYRMIGTADQEARYLASHINDTKQVKKLAMMVPEHDYSLGSAKAFRAAFKGEVVAEESCIPSDQDFKSQLLRIQRANADAILIPAWGKITGLIVKQARKMGITLPIYCTQACKSPDLIDGAGGFAEGVEFSTPDHGTSDQFEEKFKKLYNRETHVIAIRMHDTIVTLSTLANLCLGDPNIVRCIKTKLASIGEIDNTTGVLKFDEFGDIQDRFVIEKVVAGKFVPVKNQ